MGTLLEAMASAGLVSDSALSTEEQRRDAEIVKKNKFPEYTFSMDDVRAAGTIQSFKAAAKDVLMRRPDLLSEVIQEAHRFKKFEPEGRRLIANLYRVRESLKGVTDQRHQRRVVAREFQL